MRDSCKISSVRMSSSLNWPDLNKNSLSIKGVSLSHDPVVVLLLFSCILEILRKFFWNLFWTVWLRSQCHLYIWDSLRPSWEASSFIFSLDQIGFLSNSTSSRCVCSLFFLNDDWTSSSRCTSLSQFLVFFEALLALGVVSLLRLIPIVESTASAED